MITAFVVGIIVSIRAYFGFTPLTLGELAVLAVVIKIVISGLLFFVFKKPLLKISQKIKSKEKVQEQ